MSYFHNMEKDCCRYQIFTTLGCTTRMIPQINSLMLHALRTVITVVNLHFSGIAAVITAASKCYDTESEKQQVSKIIETSRTNTKRAGRI
jgi:hypothetical protein